MKICPVCKNKGFKPSEAFNRPLIHRGKKNYAGLSVRYYYCINCNTRFKTVEKLQEVIKELDLFTDDLEKGDSDD